MSIYPSLTYIVLTIHRFALYFLSVAEFRPDVSSLLKGRTSDLILPAARGSSPDPADVDQRVVPKPWPFMTHGILVVYDIVILWWIWMVHDVVNIWLILMVIIWLMMVNNHLVGGWFLPPWKMMEFVSWDDDIPYIMENMFQTTN